MRERIDVLITLLYIALRNDNEVEINRLMALVSDPIERVKMLHGTLQLAAESFALRKMNRL
ncbi:MAG: hypothetical protein RIT35_637, partial [Pseudomonadota bacterium]